MGVSFCEILILRNNYEKFIKISQDFRAKNGVSCEDIKIAEKGKTILKVRTGK